MGFFQEEDTYLRNLLNIIDFFVVVSGFCVGIDSLENFSILRLFRVFLILKSFNFFQGAVIMFSTISKSLWQFVSITILMLYLFGIFAILGLNVYSGVLSQRCRTTSAPIDGVWPVDNSTLRVCGGSFQCPTGEYCGSDYEYIDQLNGSVGTDLFYSEFEWGLMNFDNILNSMATIFVLMSMVGWSNIFDMVVDATDKASSLIFFVMTILIILAFTINMVVAIIVDEFSRHRPKEYLKSMSRSLSVARSNTSTIFIPANQGFSWLNPYDIIYHLKKRYRTTKQVLPFLNIEILIKFHSSLLLLITLPILLFLTSTDSYFTI